MASIQDQFLFKSGGYDRSHKASYLSMYYKHLAHVLATDMMHHGLNLNTPCSLLVQTFIYSDNGSKKAHSSLIFHVHLNLSKTCIALLESLNLGLQMGENTYSGAEFNLRAGSEC